MPRESEIRDDERDTLYQPNGQPTGQGQNNQAATKRVPNPAVNNAIVNKQPTGQPRPTGVTNQPMATGFGPPGEGITAGPVVPVPQTAPGIPRPPGGAIGGAAPGANPLNLGRNVSLTGREDPSRFAGQVNPAIWNDPNSQELNRRFLRILSRYGTNPDAVRMAMQDPEWLADADLSRATYLGEDKFDFHGAPSEPGGVGVNIVDFLQSFDRGTGQSAGLQWIDQNFVDDPQGTPGPSKFGPANDIYANTQNTILNPPSQHPDGLDPNTIFYLLQQLMAQNTPTEVPEGGFPDELRNIMDIINPGQGQGQEFI